MKSECNNMHGERIKIKKNRFLFNSRTVCLYEIHQCSDLGHLMDSLSLKTLFYKLYSAYCLTLRLACNIVKRGGERTFFEMAEKSFVKND